MASSADVAAQAGVSRSTVSQILNGHGHRFRPDMVERVETAARELGYRPSLAGRTLVRGTSDVVITLIPNITFGPRLRDLIDRVTVELAAAGVTNLLRLASFDDAFEDAILALKPRGVWSVAPLPAELHARLADQNVAIIHQSHEFQQAIDREIGALQAAHLHESGYRGLAVAMPVDLREQPYALAREQGAVAWAQAHGIPVHPTLHLDLGPDGIRAAADVLPPESFGIACYNDDVGLAVLSAASRAGRAVPADLGVIGVDNSPIAQITEPPLTTVDINLEFSAHEIVRAVLEGTALMPEQALDAIRDQLHVLPAASTGR